MLSSGLPNPGLTPRIPHHYDFCLGGLDVRPLSLHQSPGHFWLKEVVDAAAAATQIGFAERNQLETGHRLQELPGRGTHTLPVDQVASIVVRRANWQTCGFPQGFLKSCFHQKLSHIPDAFPPAILQVTSATGRIHHDRQIIRHIESGFPFPSFLSHPRMSMQGSAAAGNHPHPIASPSQNPPGRLRQGGEHSSDDTPLQQIHLPSDRGYIRRQGSPPAFDRLWHINFRFPTGHRSAHHARHPTPRSEPPQRRSDEPARHRPQHPAACPSLGHPFSRHLQDLSVFNSARTSRLAGAAPDAGIQRPLEVGIGPQNLFSIRKLGEMDSAPRRHRLIARFQKRRATLQTKPASNALSGQIVEGLQREKFSSFGGFLNR